MRSKRSITPFFMTSGGVDLPQLLAGAAWSQSEGLQENRNMMQNDLLERIEFRTSIASDFIKMVLDYFRHKI